MADQVEPFKIENAELIWKNFTGREQQFNPEGTRKFTCILPMEVAERMAADGWNVKYLNPREEGELPRACIEVKVNYNIRPPHITVISSTGRLPLTEATVSMLDDVQMANVDLIARPYHWKTATGSGISAYLQTMYVTLAEDDLQRKYAQMEDGD